METTLYKHRIYCITEAGWAYLWKEDDVLLTTCPNDPAHTVQAGSASVVDQIDPNVAVINKEVGITTGGHVRTDSLAITAPGSGNASVTRTWDYDVALYSITLAVTDACVGCTLTAEAAPLTPVGTLTADAPIGTTVLSVSPSVTSVITPGIVATLTMGATTQEVGVVTAVNQALNTITVKSATTSNFLAAGPTVVKATNRATDHLELPLVGYRTFGEGRTKTVNFPATTPLVLTLYNPNLLSARLVVHVSYNC